MTNKTPSIVSRIIKILLTVSIILSGIVLSYGCLTIYFAESHTYSREIVAEVFSKIDIPVYITLGLVIVSIIYNLILYFFSDGSKEKSSMALLSAKERVKLLSSKKDFTCIDEATADKLQAQHTKRRLISILFWLISLASAVYFLCYALKGSHFTEDINASVISAMWILLPCLLVILAASIIAEVLTEKSYAHELEIIKKLPKKENAPEDDKKKKVNVSSIIRISLLFVAIVALVYGFFAGGTADVLTKAVNICTECIGLG